MDTNRIKEGHSWRDDYSTKHMLCPSCGHQTLLYDSQYRTWFCNDCHNEFRDRVGKDGKVIFTPVGPLKEDTDNKSLKNILKDRANYHSKRQKGLSPFCSLGERLENEGENMKNYLMESSDDKITLKYRGIIYTCEDTHIKQLTQGDKVILVLGREVKGVGTFVKVSDVSVDRRGRAQYCIDVELTEPETIHYTTWQYTPFLYKVVGETEDSERINLSDKTASINIVFMGTIGRLREIESKYNVTAEKVNSNIVKLSGRYDDIMRYAEDSGKVDDVVLNEKVLKEAQHTQYDEDALAQFFSEIPRDLEGAFNAFGYDLQTVHLKDLRRDFTNIFENILRRLRSLAGVCFDKYNENDLTNAYIDNGKNNGNFLAFTHYLIKQVTDEQWEEVKTDDPCKYALENCKNDELYLIRGYKGAQKVSAKKYVNNEMFGNRSHTVGIGSAQSVHHYSSKLVKDRAGNIGVIQSSYIYDSLNNAHNKTTLTETAGTWMLIKTDKYYDPEGLDIEPQGKVLCRGTERECRNEFSKYVIKARQDSAREAERAKRNHHAPFVRLEKLDLYSLVICYPHAQAKDVYQLIPCNDAKSVDNEMSLNEDHMIQNYKGYELDWDRDGVDPDEGIADFTVHIRKHGKDITDKDGSALAFNGFRKAKQWIDSHSKKCTYKEKLVQIGRMFDKGLTENDVDDSGCWLAEFPVIRLDDSSNNIPAYLYCDSEFNWTLVKGGPNAESIYSDTVYDWIMDTWSALLDEDEYRDTAFSDDGKLLTIDDLRDDAYYDSPAAWTAELIMQENNSVIVDSPVTVTGRGLSSMVDALVKYGNCKLDSDTIELLKDENDCSDVTTLTESKKKKPFDSINKNAGNVKHNIAMFSKANSPIDAPCNNPISGPMGGDVSCCEDLDSTKKVLAEKMRLRNGMVEREEYYFDDGDYSYHFFDNANAFGKTDRFAILVIDYGFKFNYDQQYTDEKTGTIVIPTSLRHETPKQICYFEFTEESHPDIFDAMIDDNIPAFRAAVKAETERQLKTSGGLIEAIVTDKKKDIPLDDNFDMFLRGI